MFDKCIIWWRWCTLPGYNDRKTKLQINKSLITIDIHNNLNLFYSKDADLALATTINKSR